MSDFVWDLVVDSGDLDEPLGSCPDVKQVMELVSDDLEPTSYISDLLGDRRVLGIDPSATSTGIFVWDGPRGEGFSRYLPPLDHSGDFGEVVMRREFRSRLLELLVTLGIEPEFDLIAVEDAFVGRSHSVARLLYALNSAIDEMVYDEELACESFHRLGNQTWKTRWRHFTGAGLVGGRFNKDFVQAVCSYNYHCLGKTVINYVEDQVGRSSHTADCLDAYCVAVATLLPKGAKKDKVTWSKVASRVSEDQEDLLRRLPDLPQAVLTGKLSRNTICSTLAVRGNVVLVTPEPVILGELERSSPKNSNRLKPKFAAFWRNDL